MTYTQTSSRHDVERPTRSDLIPIADIMTAHPICVAPELPLRHVVGLVMTRYIGCVPVVDASGAPVGMITKRDLIEHAAHGATTAADVMMPLAFTLDERASIARAAALMAAEDVHHVPVVARSGRVIGIVSALDIVRWLARTALA